MTFLSNLRLKGILCSFILVLEEKANKEIPESPRLDIFEKIPTKIFALSDAGDITQDPLNGGGISDSLGKVIDSFVLST